MIEFELNNDIALCENEKLLINVLRSCNQQTRIVDTVKVKWRTELPYAMDQNAERLL